MSTGKKIEIRNEILGSLFTALAKMELDIPGSAARRRFFRILKGPAGDLDAERQELSIKYADKADDKPKLLKDQFVYSAKNKKELDREWEKLNQEKIVIDVLPSNEKDIAVIRDLLISDVAEKEKKSEGKFDALSFDYIEVMKEVIESLSPKEI